MLASVLGVFGLAAGALGPPLRRAMGKDARQYYGNPKSARDVRLEQEANARTAKAATNALARVPDTRVASFWVKGTVGSIPALQRTSDVEGAHMVRKSSVLLQPEE